MNTSRLAASAARAAIVHLPPRRRGRRIYRLTERLVGRPREQLRARHCSGYRVTCNLDDAVQRTLYYHGTYEPETTGLIAAALTPGDIFLDIGANAGHYTFLAARIVGPAGHVHAIEASPSTARQLSDDVRRNTLDRRVTVHQVAALDRRGRVTIRDPADPTQVGERRVSRDGGDVEAIPLDELLPDTQPAIIKVDVEGAELRVLAGMRRLLERSQPRLVIVETHPGLLEEFGDSVEATIAFMEALGYAIRPIGDAERPAALAFTVPATVFTSTRPSRA